MGTLLSKQPKTKKKKNELQQSIIGEFNSTASCHYHHHHHIINQQCVDVHFRTSARFQHSSTANSSGSIEISQIEKRRHSQRLGCTRSNSKHRIIANNSRNSCRSYKTCFRHYSNTSKYCFNCFSWLYFDLKTIAL